MWFGDIAHALVHESLVLNVEDERFANDPVDEGDDYHLVAQFGVPREGHAKWTPDLLQSPSN